MRRVITTAILLCGAMAGFLAALADPAPIPPQDLLHGEFERAGPTFACRVDSRLTAEQQNQLNPANCLWLGKLAIGEDARAVLQSLGTANRTLSQPKDSVAAVYFFGNPHTSYLVATVSKGRIVALQISGNGPADNWQFNHVALGMQKQKLLQLLGEPRRTERVPDNGADLISYAPWPFSFEVLNDRVISIRIADPDFF